MIISLFLCIKGFNFAAFFYKNSFFKYGKDKYNFKFKMLFMAFR